MTSLSFPRPTLHSQIVFRTSPGCAEQTPVQSRQKYEHIPITLALTDLLDPGFNGQHRPDTSSSKCALIPTICACNLVASNFLQAAQRQNSRSISGCTPENSILQICAVFWASICVLHIIKIDAIDHRRRNNLGRVPMASTPAHLNIITNSVCK